MLERFSLEYQIVKVYKNTLLCVNKKTRKEVMIHNSNYNSLDKAVDYREMQITFFDKKTGESKPVTVIEVLVWKGINMSYRTKD